jgi:hypothetical protein
MRNMWVYQGLDGEDTPALRAMAEHHWPSFPTSMTRMTRQRTDSGLATQASGAPAEAEGAGRR